MAKILLLVLALSSGLACGQVEVRELVTRPNVTVRFIYAKAANPIASAVLFQGGTGNVGILPDGTPKIANFLSGGAARFSAAGITVAIVDVPSDRRTLDMFRHSPEHAADVAAVIAFLREQSPLPVWAIGTSNGSLSAASAAELLKERGPDGIVLTSSVTNNPRINAHAVTDAALDQITVPTLFVHHRNDACPLTPYRAITGVVASMKKAKKVELITIEGGESRGPPCSTGHHQFLGVEAAVTQQIADWIKLNQPGKTNSAKN